MKLFYRFLAHLSRLEYRSYYIGDRTSQALMSAYYLIALSISMLFMYAFVEYIFN